MRKFLAMMAITVGLAVGLIGFGGEGNVSVTPNVPSAEAAWGSGYNCHWYWAYNSWQGRWVQYRYCS